MNRKEKQRRAQRYLLALARLERKCEEAARWESIAEGSDPGGGNQVKVAALHIRAECEELTRQVQELRGDLMRALEQMQTERLREVLEWCYLSGRPLSKICEQKGWSFRYGYQVRSEALDELGRVSGYFKDGSQNLKNSD